MFRQLRRLISASIALAVVSTLALDVRGQAKLADFETLAHLAEVDAETHSHHDSDAIASHDPNDHDDQQATHTHRHRHSPNEPEHEHSHGNSALLTAVAIEAPVPITVFGQLHFRETSSRLRPLNEALPADTALSSILRPPIA